MRKLSLTLVAAMLLSAGTLMANDVKVSPTKSLSSQISAMLSKNSLKDMKSDLTGQVRFTLNAEGEIVILSVETDFDNLENFVKSKLNYQHVELDKIIEGKIYTVPVTIKA